MSGRLIGGESFVGSSAANAQQLCLKKDYTKACMYNFDGACSPTVYQAIPLNYHTNLDGACSPILSTHPTSNHSISLDSACSPIELTRPTFNSQVILVVITTSTLL